MRIKVDDLSGPEIHALLREHLRRPLRSLEFLRKLRGQ